MTEKRTNMKLSYRLLVLLCLMGIGLVITSVLGELVGNQGLLTLLTLQAIFAFILPAIVAMAIFYRKPFEVMCLNRAPGWKAILLVIVFFIVSLPAMNWLVKMNEAMSLPSFLQGIEEYMRNAEEMAAEATKEILNIQNVGQLLVCILVVGFMAGLSEETLFRGAMLRTMEHSRLNTHAVVWIVAILFSALHFQFYGFVPRMLLGVWLGYLLVWTRSLWVPIIAHTLNNSTVIVFSYLANKGILAENFGDNLGLPADGAFPWLATISLIASIALAMWAHRHYTCAKTSLDKG